MIKLGNRVNNIDQCRSGRSKRNEHDPRCTS